MRTQIVAMVVAVALVISVLPVAVAQQDEGQNLAQSSTLTQGVQDDSTLIQQYRDARDAWIHALDANRDARQGYFAALNTWRQNHNETNRTAARGAARTFVSQSITACIDYLNMAKAWAEKSYQIIPENVKNAIVSEADNDIAWLQTQQALVPTATASELQNIGQAVKDYWENTRVRVKRFVGKLLCATVDAIINRAEGLSLKLKEKIENLNAQGIDTSTMETYLASFDSKIASAKEQVELAKQKFENITTFEEMQVLFLQGRAYIAQARVYLGNAWSDLKDLVKAIKAAGGTVTISGTGWLTAEGNGHASLSGTGTIRVVALESGNMIVSNNATVTIGAGSQGTVENQDNQRVYTGFGSATVTGTDITVQIDGNGISLVAKGTGTVTLAGNGTYTTHGATESTYDWSEAGGTVNLADISAVS